MLLGIELYIDRFSRINFPRHDLDVNQYYYDNFSAARKVNQPIFSLDLVDLSYSTARTLCSFHLSKKELYFDVIASMLNHLNFIDSTQTNFLLSESRYKRLRDFSKSTRIGEMAQGINALFVAKRLNFPYIIDFDLAKEKTQLTLNIQTQGKTPDFVFLDSSFEKIGLFESKGTMNGSVSGKTGFLSKGKNQIDDVNNPPCFDFHLPMCTKFANNNDVNLAAIPNNRRSSINYALRTINCGNRKDLQLLKKIHYASWFYLVGDFERVDKILNEGVVIPILDNDDPIYSLDEETDKNNPIFWVKNPLRSLVSSKENGINIFIDVHTFHRPKSDFKIGIYKKIVEELVSNSNSDSNRNISENLDDINYLRKYPDGTVLFIRTI
jgi:hypothetical protein